MRIIVDMQGAQTSASAHRGVGRYTINLVKALAQQNPSHDMILVLNGEFQESIQHIRETFSGLIPQNDIRVWTQYLRFTGSDQTTVCKRKVCEFMRETFIRSLNPDIVFSTNLQEGMSDVAVTGVKDYTDGYLACSTLHDVIPLIRNGYLEDQTVRSWYMQKIEAVERSDIVLTVSESSRDEICRVTRVERNKIHVVPNAVDHNTFKVVRSEINETALRARLKLLDRKFILYVGGADEHKDLITLYKAFALLPGELQRQYSLVLVGQELKATEARIRKTVSSLGINEGLIFLGKVSDSDLVLLLNACSLFVFPSTHEGFGLPPLEAMACGAPVIVSSTPSLVEVANAQMVFEVGNSFDLAQKIVDVLTRPEVAKSLSTFGIRRASEFTWEKSASMLLQILENAYALGCYDGRLAKKDQCPNEEYILTSIKNIISDDDSLREIELIQIAKAVDENFPPVGRPRVLFLDISAVIINGEYTGIQRVVREIGASLLTTSDRQFDVQLIYTTPQDCNYFRAKNIEETWRGRSQPLGAASSQEDEIVTFYPEDVLLYLDLHPAVAISRFELNRKLQNSGVKIFHVMYDMLPVQFPDCFWPELTNEFGNWLNSLRRASGVICISKSVANEFKLWASESWCEVPYVTSFKLGFDFGHLVSKLGHNSEELPKAIYERKTFIMIGTLEPRKGHALVLEGFEILWNSGFDLNLVFVGKKGWSVDELTSNMFESREWNNRLYWLDSVSDDALKTLYYDSTCLIAASIGEGFGLPLVEAAHYSLPIIARDISVFREVAGASAFYFSGSNAHELSNEIRRWLELYEAGLHPRSEKMETVTWGSSSKQLADIVMKNH